MSPFVAGFFYLLSLVVAVRLFFTSRRKIRALGCGVVIGGLGLVLTLAARPLEVDRDSYSRGVLHVYVCTFDKDTLDKLEVDELRLYARSEIEPRLRQRFPGSTIAPFLGELNLDRVLDDLTGSPPDRFGRRDRVLIVGPRGQDAVEAKRKIETAEAALGIPIGTRAVEVPRLRIDMPSTVSEGGDPVKFTVRAELDRPRQSEPYHLILRILRSGSEEPVHYRAVGRNLEPTDKPVAMEVAQHAEFLGEFAGPDVGRSVTVVAALQNTVGEVVARAARICHWARSPLGIVRLPTDAKPSDFVVTETLGSVGVGVRAIQLRLHDDDSLRFNVSELNKWAALAVEVKPVTGEEQKRTADQLERFLQALRESTCKRVVFVGRLRNLDTVTEPPLPAAEVGRRIFLACDWSGSMTTEIFPPKTRFDFAEELGKEIENALKVSDTNGLIYAWGDNGKCKQISGYVSRSGGAWELDHHVREASTLNDPLISDFVSVYDPDDTTDGGVVFSDEGAAWKGKKPANPGDEGILPIAPKAYLIAMGSRVDELKLRGLGHEGPEVANATRIWIPTDGDMESFVKAAAGKLFAEVFPKLPVATGPALGNLPPERARRLSEFVKNTELKLVAPYWEWGLASTHPLRDRTLLWYKHWDPEDNHVSPLLVEGKLKGEPTKRVYICCADSWANLAVQNATRFDARSRFAGLLVRVFSALLRETRRDPLRLSLGAAGIVVARRDRDFLKPDRLSLSRVVDGEERDALFREDARRLNELAVIPEIGGDERSDLILEYSDDDDQIPSRRIELAWEPAPDLPLGILDSASSDKISDPDGRTRKVGFTTARWLAGLILVLIALFALEGL